MLFKSNWTRKRARRGICLVLVWAGDRLYRLAYRIYPEALRWGARADDFVERG